MTSLTELAPLWAGGLNQNHRDGVGQLREVRVASDVSLRLASALTSGIGPAFGVWG